MTDKQTNSLTFHKMHGLGNDFILLDLRDGQKLPSTDRLQLLADRRLGLGCDQIMVISDPLDGGHIRLDMFNADGSVAGACGNGTRCVAWFEMQQTSHEHLQIETISGMLSAQKSKADMICVNMGKPRFNWNDIPLSHAADAQKLAFDTMPFGPAFCVNMGNPHAVFITPDASAVDVEKWGAYYESHPHFSDRANIEFISATGHNVLRMRVYERGVGITRACGSGACAAGVAALCIGEISGYQFNEKVEVILDGGSLLIEWSGQKDEKHSQDVLMTGPISYVGSGHINPDLLDG